MSEDEEDNFQMYGTLLDPYDEDNIPKKKAFSIEDQVATDEHGRRRFHGAFTGGFSAGFFNTVGSLEGWVPSEFKSSRSEKAGKKFQKPEDFMDEEDTGTFGIAPKVVRATSDYSNLTKRKITPITEGPIPGVPVLHSLLEPAKETVGVRLLKRMGWKPGQGIGPRLTKSDKLKAKREQKKHTGKIYGCEIPSEFKPTVINNSDSESLSDEESFEVTFAPDDYEAYTYKPKDNTFGMGYSGLDKRMLLSNHISLFNPPEFRMQDRNNKKVAISGQAFGVGAFEKEDEDIYSRDDMSKYDFELDSFGTKNKKLQVKNKVPLKKDDFLDGFIPAKHVTALKKIYAPPVLPRGFIPKHGARVSRFEPLPEQHKLFNYDRLKTTPRLGRHELSASDRSKIINTQHEIITQTSTPTPSTSKSIPKTTEEDKEKSVIIENAKKITENLLPTTSSSGFKPFVANPEKQNRYEQYIALIKSGQREKLIEIQPASMTDWERERERFEFEQASRLYRPVAGLIFDKFVTASNPEDAVDPLRVVTRSIYEHGTEEMREAARKKMFGPLTRVVLVWKPHKILCRRFNVPEPDTNSDTTTMTSKRKNKFNIFDYFEAYQQNKTLEGPKSKEELSKTSDKNCEKPESTDIESKNTNLESSTNKNNLNKKDSSEELQKSEINSNISTFSIDDKQLEIDNSKLNIVSSQPQSDSKIISSLSDSDLKHTQTTAKEPLKVVSSPGVFYNRKMSLPEPTVLTVPTDPAAKKDLFKAIFASSSESESENEEIVQKKEETLTEMKKIVVQENITKPVQDLQPKFISRQNRGTSKGFFSDLDLSKISKPHAENIPELEVDNLYGPKLPTNNQEKIWKPTFNKNDNRISKPDTEVENEWVEISDNTNDETEKPHKTKKKHKKHKSDKKNSKTKHRKHKKKKKDCD